MKMEEPSFDISGVLTDYFRCPSFGLSCQPEQQFSALPIFLRAAEQFAGYGRITERRVRPGFGLAHVDPPPAVEYESGAMRLPFYPIEVIDNLRLERYVEVLPLPSYCSAWITRLYYALRPLLPVGIRKRLQRARLRGWESRPFPRWPLDCTVDHFHEWLLASAMQATGVREVPIIWFWPDEFGACAVITHDVETVEGRDRCGRLMDLDDSFAIKSSFQVVPEGRYEVSESYLDAIRKRGFEVNVHDLNHDGTLFSSREKFLSRVGRINEYGKLFRAEGFRSAVLYRNPDWMSALQFEYDMSVPNVAHLDPQPGGCCTVMPYFIGDLLELPVTTIQDYSLFHILGQYSIDLWKRQTQAILTANGLINTIVHPDYLVEKRTEGVYRQFLAYLSELRSVARLWITTPKQVNDWWRRRAKMQLILDKYAMWRIEGVGSEGARIALARLDHGHISYQVPGIRDSYFYSAPDLVDTQSR
jgi:hypothetical protein